MKLPKAASFALVALLALAACKPSDGPSGGGGDPGGDDPGGGYPAVQHLIPRELWGEWRGVEQNSDGYYFAADLLFSWDYRVERPETEAERKVLLAKSDVIEYLPTNALGAAMPTFAACTIERVPGEENFIIFTKGGDDPRPLFRVSSASALSGKAVSGAPDPSARKRALTSAATVSLVIQNALNAADLIELDSDASGVFTAPAAIAGDVYMIKAATPATGTTAPVTPVAILPGQTDAGIVPVPASASDVATTALPKLIIEPSSFEDWGSNGRFTRAGVLSTGWYYLRNPTDETIEDLSWTISCPAGGSLGAGASGTLSELGSLSYPLAAGAKTVGTSLEFTPDLLPEGVDYAYVDFIITFSMGETSWQDSFRLRVYSPKWLNIRLRSGYASTMIRSPVGTIAFFSANGAVTSPAGCSVPYIAGDWQVVVSEPYRNSSSLTGGTPYSWSADGPLLPGSALASIVDANEPNDTPGTATAVDYRDLVSGKLSSGDYDFFKLSLPAQGAESPDYSSLPFSNDTSEDIKGLDLDLDDSGAPMVGGLWHRSDAAWMTRVGAWTRSGSAWSASSIGSFDHYSATDLAIKAESDGASVILQVNRAAERVAYDRSQNAWSAAGEYIMSKSDNTMIPSRGFPASGASFGADIGGSLGIFNSWANSTTSESGVGLMWYDEAGSEWRFDDYTTGDSPTVYLAVAGSLPAILYAAGGELKLGLRSSPGSWTSETIGAFTKQPSFASRDDSGDLWLGWTSASQLELRSGSGGTEKWLLPGSTPYAAGRDADGTPWVLIKEELHSDLNTANKTYVTLRLWILKLKSRGIYGADLLYDDYLELGGVPPVIMPFVRVREDGDKIYAVWAFCNYVHGTSPTWYREQWEIYAAERSGY